VEQIGFEALHSFFLGLWDHVLGLLFGRSFATYVVVSWSRRVSERHQHSPRGDIYWFVSREQDGQEDRWYVSRRVIVAHGRLVVLVVVTNGGVAF